MSNAGTLTVLEPFAVSAWPLDRAEAGEHVGTRQPAAGGQHHVAWGWIGVRHWLQRSEGEDAGHAFPSVSVNDVTENACAAAKEVLSTVMSPPLPVAVTVPCMCAVVPSLA